MATRRQVAALLSRLRLGDEDFNELADQLFTYAVAVYRDTLEDLAEQHGFELPDEPLTLSPAIHDALGADAERRAESIIEQYNDELANRLDTLADKTVPEIVADIDEWAAERGDRQADRIALDATYTPHADATLAFYRDTGLEPLFDFGGHGDEPPKCDLCRRLLETSPHTLATVVDIGTPHHGCRQSWHANVDDDELPDEIDLGQADPAGVIGRDTWLQRHGSLLEAAAALPSG
jgi:hypothetical protein